MLCLLCPTDPRWAEVAVSDLGSLLSDHAHCEMKAASNALSLAGRWTGYPRLVKALAELAEEELRHFRAVLAELERRGIALGKPEIDVYAAELRKAASKRGQHSAGAALVDRLLVGALIEARSCERFRLLERALRARGETALAAFYDDLFAAEARHYTTFVELAIDVAGDVAREEAREREAAGKRAKRKEPAEIEADVRARLLELAEAESELVSSRSRLGAGPTIHG